MTQESLTVVLALLVGCTQPPPPLPKEVRHTDGEALCAAYGGLDRVVSTTGTISQHRHENRVMVSCGDGSIVSRSMEWRP